MFSEELVWCKQWSPWFQTEVDFERDYEILVLNKVIGGAAFCFASLFVVYVLSLPSKSSTVRVCRWMGETRPTHPSLPAAFVVLRIYLHLTPVGKSTKLTPTHCPRLHILVFVVQ